MKRILKEIGIVLSLGFGGKMVNDGVIKPTIDNSKKIITRTFYPQTKSKIEKEKELPKIIKTKPIVYRYPYSTKKEKKELITKEIGKNYESFMDDPDFWMANWTKPKIKWLDGNGKKYKYYYWKTYGETTDGSQIRRLFWILKNKDPYYLDHLHMGKMSWKQQFNWLLRLLNRNGFLKM